MLLTYLPVREYKKDCHTMIHAMGTMSPTNKPTWKIDWTILRHGVSTMLLTYLPVRECKKIAIQWFMPWVLCHQPTNLPKNRLAYIEAWCRHYVTTYLPVRKCKKIVTMIHAVGTMSPTYKPSCKGLKNRFAYIEAWCRHYVTNLPTCKGV